MGSSSACLLTQAQDCWTHILLMVCSSCKLLEDARGVVPVCLQSKLCEEGS